MGTKTKANGRNRSCPIYSDEKIDWSKVKFDRPDLEIAMSLGTAKATVAAQRRKRGLKAVLESTRRFA